MFKQKLTKKRYYKYQIDKIQRGVWDMELRIITIKTIREGIRREFDRVAGVVKSLGEKIAVEKDEAKKQELLKTQKDYQGDVDALREQMLGKWSEKEAKYNGGIDAEVATIQEKIQGALEFQALIKNELKKL
jgi:hypothetical protein